MHKRTSLIIIVLILILVFLLYLLSTAKQVNYRISREQDRKTAENNQITEVVDRAELERDYRALTKSVFIQFEGLIENEEPDAEEINNLKNSVLNIVVPTEYKELHFELFQAISKFADFIASTDSKGKSIVLNMTREMKKNYDWLN
jgi:hypothetical protein